MCRRSDFCQGWLFSGEKESVENFKAKQSKFESKRFFLSSMRCKDRFIGSDRRWKTSRNGVKLNL